MINLIDYFNKIAASDQQDREKKKKLLESLYFDIIISWNPFKRIQWSEAASIAGDIKQIRTALEDDLPISGLNLRSNRIRQNPYVQKALAQPENATTHRDILSDQVVKKFQYYIEVVMIADAINREYDKQLAQQILTAVATLVTIILSALGAFKLFNELLFL